MRPPKVKDPVFLLDYDGTLAEIAARPELATPHPEASGLIAELAGRYPLYLVSGRRLSELSKLLGPLGVAAFGVHGAEEGRLGGEAEGRVDAAWRERVEPLVASLPPLPGLWVEDKGAAIALHYRGAPDEELVLAELKKRLLPPPPGVSVLFGKKVVELKPKGVGKGAVAREVAARHPGRTLVMIGDDATDEEMFRAARGVAVKVGPGESAAPYRLAGPDEVVRYLKQYLEEDEDQHP